MTCDTQHSRNFGKIQMSSLKRVLCALILLASALMIGHCQDAGSMRTAANNGEKTSDASAAMRTSGGTSTRAVYSPRLAYGPHHQIMHFGKRPAIPLPSRAYDLYWQQKQQQQAINAANKFPWSVRMDQGQQFPLEPLEEEMTAFEFAEPIVQNRMPIYSIISQPTPTPSSDSFSLFDSLPSTYVNRLLQQANVQQQANNQDRFSSRLINNNNEPDDNSNTDSDNLSRAPEQLGTAGISVATRSPHSAGRTSAFGSGSSSGKNYISTLLLGRASTPSMGGNFGSFIKKAEPKDNVFMHFGRK